MTNKKIGEHNQYQQLCRRTVLRAAAVSASGALAFTGIAGAVGPKLMQVNFCGCSQVCVVREEENKAESFTDNSDDSEPENEVGPNTVILARETDEGWEFDNVIHSTGYVCDESGEDGDWKIIGVYACKEVPKPNKPCCFIGNPTQCAAKALDEYRSEVDIACVNGNPPDFGEFGGMKCNKDKDYQIKVVRGLCGTPGKDRANPNRGGPPDDGGDDDNGRGRGRGGR